MRIAVGGLAVECCTFSPLRTQLDDFTVHRGTALLDLYPFLQAYPDVTFVPLVRARATPGGAVDAATYAAFKEEFIEGLRGGAWDGVYLDLHGAMFVDGMQDAEGDWIAAVRACVGADVLIAASYDLHGNLSQRVIDNLDVLTAYRTAPHVDIDETRARAVHLLIACLRETIRPVLAFARIPMLLVGEKAMTTSDPTQRLYASLPAVMDEYGLLDASLLVGYAWADEPRVGAAAVTVGRDAVSAQAAVRQMQAAWWAARHEFAFGMPTGTIDACIAQAQADVLHGTPVFLSDAGDNITGGGVGDVTAVLAALLRADVQNAVYAAIWDAAAVAACIAGGLHARLTLSVGGRHDTQHASPLPVEGTVVALNTTDPANRQAVMAVQGVRVILTERRTAFTTRAVFEALEIDVSACDIVAVKLGYLFPELRDVAKAAFLVFSPGAINPHVEILAYQHLTRPIFPLDGDAAFDSYDAPRG
jgi:microcystin degradation protein MlrC